MTNFRKRGSYGRSRSNNPSFLLGRHEMIIKYLRFIVIFYVEFSMENS